MGRNGCGLYKAALVYWNLLPIAGAGSAQHSYVPSLPPSASNSLSLTPPSHSLSLSGCLPAGQEHAIEIERTPNAALAFPDPFHDAATTHPPLSPPSLLLFTVFLLHAGRGRSVVSPGVACHLAKAVILLLAKYKSECCANYS